MHERYSLILAGGGWNERTGIARSLSGDGWRVTPVDSYDEVDAALVGRAILVFLAQEDTDIARITARMARDAIWLPFIACMEGENRLLAAKAYHAGAIGHLGWPFAADELRELAAQAEPTMRGMVVRQNTRADAKRRLAVLTARERDVLAAMIADGSNKMIASRLGLSPRTVEVYRSRIMQRLGVDHMTRVLWLAFQSEEFGAVPKDAVIGALPGTAA